MESARLGNFPGALRRWRLGTGDLADVSGCSEFYHGGCLGPAGRRRSGIAADPIQGVPKTVETFVVCSNMARGRQVIDAVDRWLDDPAHWEKFTAPYRAWYDQADYRILIGQTGP